MFGFFGDVAAGGEPAQQRRVGVPTPVEARLLWAVRRLSLFGAMAALVQK